ncbi:MAG: triose-phosphate isomerase [Planctomycetes bacterium]|nr:triose-phosphate isomerase [Planctomycetota bacterium]
MPIVGGNWKMNTDLASAVELAEDVVAGCGTMVESCDVAMFPPFPYLQAVGRALGHHGLVLGAQDVYPKPDGAFTGEVSTAMLLDLHAEMVLVGHSERRHVIGERDDLIAAKLTTALAAGLKVVLCIGETKEQRTAGTTRDVLNTQLTAGLGTVDADGMRDVIIAYEPVWAIGTGETATPEDAESEHAFVRERLAELYDADIADATRIQYGGSVKPNNAEELIAGPNIDGFLVGGASLKADDFLAIIRAAAATADAGSSERSYREARNA